MERLKPKLRFSEFKGDWERKSLGNIFSIFNGYAFSSSDSIDDGVLWVKIADVGIQEMKKDNLSFLPKEYIEKHKKFILKKDDYVIALTRPILNGKLKIAKIDDFFNGSLLNQRVGKLITSNNSTFVFNILQKDLLIKSIENNISGSDPPNLSPNEISFIETFIPSVQEQTKIANFLSSVDEKLNLLKEKKELLLEYKKGIMQKIFNQEIRFKDDNGNDFEDWKKVILSEVFDYKKGSGLSKDKLDDNGIFECVLYGELYTKYSEVIFEVKSKTNSNEGLLSEIGDLLIPSSTTTSGIDLANVTALNFDNVLLGGDITVLRSNQEVSSVFYAYYLSNHKKEEIASYAQGITIVHLYYSHIKDMLIDFPTFEEQTKIANFLSAIDEKIELVSSQIQDTQEYKKGLLQQIFV